MSKKITYLAASFINPDARMRISTEEQLRQLLASKYVTDTIRKIRTVKETDPVKRKMAIANLKNRLPFIIMTGYSDDSVTDWQAKHYRHIGHILVDVDKNLAEDVTAKDILEEYKNELQKAGKTHVGRLMYACVSPSGDPKSRFLIRVPYAESTFDVKQDLENEKHYFGRFETSIDKGASAMVMRPQFANLEEEILYIDGEALFNLPDEWTLPHTPPQGRGVDSIVIDNKSIYSFPLGKAGMGSGRQGMGSGPVLGPEEYLLRHPLLREELREEGGRNAALFKFAVNVKRYFPSVEDLINAMAGYTTLPQREVESVCRSAWNRD